MFDIEKWQEIWFTINKHRVRTILTAFGVFWGIFMLVLLLGAGKGLENGATQNFDIAKNSIFVWTRSTALPYAGLKAGRNIRLTNDDYKALQGIKEIEVIAPRNRLSLSLERKEYSINYSTTGDYPSYQYVKPMLLEEGRFINDLDIEERRKIIIIGSAIKNELFDNEEKAIGSYIELGGIPFKVVGILGSKMTGQEAMEDLQAVYIPNTTMQRVFGMNNYIHWFGFVPKKGISATVVEESVKELLRKRHKISPKDQRALGSWNAEKTFNEIQGLFSGISAFSWMVAIGTILAGMIGVGNIMLIIVKERTKEFGIRKSVGARPWSIVSMVIQESLVISGVSGYFGLLAGVALIEGITLAMKRFNIESEFFKNPEINFQVAVTAIVVLLLAGILAGLFPGIKAASVNPVIALRDE